MSEKKQQDEVELLLNEAAYRLQGAVEHAPTDDDDDARIACENAHDAIEVSLNAVIVARGEKYRASHDLSQLAEIAKQAGEAIPAELEGIRSLRPYTGGGRYSYRGTGRIEPATKNDYKQIVDLAKGIFTWATSRARGIHRTAETWKRGTGSLPEKPPPAPASVRGL